MNPRDLSANMELAYGGGITGTAVLMNYLNDYVTPIATAVGAVAGAIVGVHALYRMVRPKNKRLYDKRKTD
jgi:outer membrane lipoprotein SlyB